MEHHTEILTSMLNPPAEQLEVAHREAMDNLRDCDAFVVLTLKQRDGWVEHWSNLSTGPIPLPIVLYAINAWIESLNAELAAHAAAGGAE